MRVTHSLALTILVVAVASAGKIPINHDDNQKAPQDHHDAGDMNPKRHHDHWKQLAGNRHPADKHPHPEPEHHPEGPHFRPTKAPDSEDVITTTQSETEEGSGDDTVATTAEISSTTEGESESEVTTTQSEAEEDTATTTPQVPNSTEARAESEVTTTKLETEEDSAVTITEIPVTTERESESEITTTESETAAVTTSTAVSENSRAIVADTTSTTKSWWQKLLFWQ